MACLSLLKTDLYLDLLLSASLKSTTMSFLAAAARIAGPRFTAARISSTSSSSRAVLRRNFSSSLRAFASGPPVIQGEGGKVGEVATDEEQSTGLERFELLGRLQGVDVFDLNPLQSDRKGTKKDPIVVASLVSLTHSRKEHVYAFHL
jgi:hypothetical protein